MIEKKKCTCCKKVKPIDEFRKLKSDKQYTSTCIACLERSKGYNRNSSVKKSKPRIAWNDRIKNPDDERFTKLTFAFRIRLI